MVVFPNKSYRKLDTGQKLSHLVYNVTQLYLVEDLKEETFNLVIT